MAIADFSQVIQKYPKAADAFFRGLIYYKKGQLSQAVADFDLALQINPGYAEAYNNRGLACKDKGQLYRAAIHFSQAIRVNPGFAEAYNNRGVVYAKIDWLERGLAHLRGVEYADKGQLDRAIVDFNNAIRINPTYADAYLNRGLAHGSKGQPAQAIADFTPAIQINPTYALAYYDRAVVYYSQRAYDQAWADVHKAQKLGYLVPWEFLGDLTRGSGRNR